jgi:prepilin-type N-terminal cleavage/methylation domain-containing protein
MREQPKERGYRDGIGQEGFTLLEAVIAMMIFAIGISAALTMEVEGINMHTRSRDHVEKVQGAVLQNETIGLALRYDDDTFLSHDGGSAAFGDADPYGASDMPVRGHALTSYTVKQDDIVRQVKMIYLTNKRHNGDRAYTITSAKPYIGRGAGD